MKRTKFFCATLISVFALFAFFSFSNPANSGTPSSHAKARGAKIINVTYDPNGGGQMSKNVYDYALGNPLGDEIPSVTRAGYAFVEWNTKKDLNGDGHGDGEVINKNTILTDSITVYAIWHLISPVFTIDLDYSYLEEDGVTLTNSPSNTATVTLNSNTYTVTAYPTIYENATRDFMGFFDKDNKLVANASGTLISNNAPYTDAAGRWILDYDSTMALTLYPRWAVSIKATYAWVDQASYSVGIGEEITITGGYYPANATTLITCTTNSTRELAITQGLECNNGQFTIRVKGGVISSQSVNFKCDYNNYSTSCSVNVILPTDTSTIPEVNPVPNSINGNSAVGRSSSNNKDDYTLKYISPENPGNIYKLYLEAGKTYKFQIADSYSATPSGVGTYLDSLLYIYNSAGTQVAYKDDGTINYPVTTSGVYYVYSCVRTYGQSGYAGFHVYLDAINSLILEPVNYYDSYRFEGNTIKFKPTDSVDLVLTYSPNSSTINNYINLWAYVDDDTVITVDDTYILPGDGNTINLYALKPGTTTLYYGDSYSGEEGQINIEVSIDGSYGDVPDTATASSNDYNDYLQLDFSEDNPYLWYSVNLIAGNKYRFETATTNTSIQVNLDSYTDVYFGLYDSAYNVISQNIYEYPCLETGTYYMCFSPDFADDTQNAVHVFVSDSINTKIDLSTYNLTLTVGNSQDIILTFNDGTPGVESNFSCSFQDSENDPSTNTRFVTVTPYVTSVGDITTSANNYEAYTFTDVPNKLHVLANVPGKTKYIFKDLKSGITKEVNITVVPLSIDTTLSLFNGPADVNTTYITDFNATELSDLKLYAIYSATFQEGVTYYFQSYDEDNVFGIPETPIDAYFYLEDSNNNIIDFKDHGTITYTCTATGTYYFVVTYFDLSEADTYTGYAGIRWYAEKITSMSDYLTSSQYFFLDADGLTHNITNDFQYTPTNAYYNFIVSNTEDSRIVGNATVAYSTRLRLNPYMPGTTYVTVRDQYSGVEHDYNFKVFPVEDDIPELPINYRAPTDIDDIYAEAEDTRVIANLSSKYYEIYSMQLQGGAKYHFLLADNDDQKGMPSTSDCQFYIEDSQYNVIDNVDNTSSDRDRFLDFTCPETGTYYFIIARRSMSGTGAVTSGGVYAYCDPITAIDSSNTLSTINLPLGGQTTFTVPFEPATAACDFVISANTSDSRWMYQCYFMLNFDETTDKIAATGNTFTLESLGLYEYNGSKYHLYDVPVTIKDQISGITKDVIIHIVPEGENLTVISSDSIPDVGPEDLSDYHVKTISQSNPAAVYSIPLQAGTRYCFNYKSSYYSYYTLYDSSLTAITSWNGYDNVYSYTPTTSGTYYITIWNYNSNTVSYDSYFYVYKPIAISSISLSKTSVTIPVGSSETITINWTPYTSEVNLSYYPNDYSLCNCYLNGNQLTMTAYVIGQTYVTISDSISGIYTTLTVKVTGDTNTAINVIPGTATATQESDFSIATLTDETPFMLYKFQMVGGRTYHFENVDSYSHGYDSIISLPDVGDCKFYIYNSSFDQVDSSDDGDINYACPTDKGGIYYYLVSRLSNDELRQGAFHIWSE